jgi:hypothetical protein
MRPLVDGSSTSACACEYRERYIVTERREAERPGNVQELIVALLYVEANRTPQLWA